MIVYDNGFDESTIIGHHDKQIKRIITNQLQDNDIFIDTTWIMLDQHMKEIIELCSENSEEVRLICYSGPDWNNTYGPPMESHRQKLVWDQLNEFNVIHIGNTRGPYYFSFWVDFVYDNIHRYQTFDPYELQTPLKHYMCLNRKPHRPRVELYNILRNRGLLKYGHTSLGEVAQLPIDIQNADGDASVQGDVGITNDISSLGHKDNWNSHFLNVVTETTVYTDVFITEKTLKPIIGKRPFIILGDNNIYQLLKDWNFDTFDDVFGTGYDSPNYEDRFNWVADVIENLVKRQDLDALLLELKPRLEHNYDNFLKIARINKKNLKHLLDKSI